MIKKLIVLLSIATTTAYAGGTYIDAGLGANTSGGSLAAALDAGYNFNRYVGAEGGLTFSSNYTMFDGAVKGTLPFSNAFNLYGKAGLGLQSGGGLGILLGLGAAFNLSSSWALHVEDYTLTNGPNFLMVGGQYKF